MTVLLSNLSRHRILGHLIHKAIGWLVTWPLPWRCPSPGFFIELSAEVRFLYSDRGAGMQPCPREDNITGLVYTDSTQHHNNIHTKWHVHDQHISFHGAYVICCQRDSADAVTTKSLAVNCQNIWCLSTPGVANWFSHGGPRTSRVH